MFVRNYGKIRRHGQMWTEMVQIDQNGPKIPKNRPFSWFSARFEDTSIAYVRVWARSPADPHLFGRCIERAW